MTKYIGLIYGGVYDATDKRIKNADKLFWEFDEGRTMEIVSELVHKHTSKYILGGFFQAGFGGDDGDGAIDYCSTFPIQQIPAMEFEVDNKKYVMKFSKSPNTIV
jgi:hypothetical protein